MERIGTKAGKLLAAVWDRMGNGIGRISLRRTVTVMVALVLWMGMGGMTASAARDRAEGGFGEVHWYEGA